MVKHSIEDNILIARFSLPPAYAMTFESLNDIREAVKKVNENDDIKGLIFTGEGKFFCSGFDFPTFMSFKTREDILNFFNVEEEMLFEIFTCSKPVIAAINGHCTAGGFIIAMGCDYRIAADNPKIKMGMTETKIGLSLTIAEMELVRSGLNSDKILRDILYNGEKCGIDKGQELGFIDEVLPEAELIDAAKKKICYWWDQPAHAFSMLKQRLRQPLASQIRHRLDTENWQDSLVDTLLNPQLKAIFDMVQKSMSGDK